MFCQLPVECLNKIFEQLRKDKVTLHSCLLVNRLCCKISIKILWTDIWEYTRVSRWVVSELVIRTLISCLPDESKDLLHEKDGFIFDKFVSENIGRYPPYAKPIRIYKPTLFNYASFIKVISIGGINTMIRVFLKNQKLISNKMLLKDIDLVTQEILKMFMSQVPYYKKLTYYLENKYDNEIIYTSNNITFTHFPGARDCLKDLSELSCDSDIHSEFYYQLSRICHDIYSLNLKFQRLDISDGLKHLISSQNSLKYLLLNVYKRPNWMQIIPSLMKHSNTLIKLEIDIITCESLLLNREIQCHLFTITNFKISKC